MKYALTLVAVFCGTVALFVQTSHGGATASGDVKINGTLTTDPTTSTTGHNIIVGDTGFGTMTIDGGTIVAAGNGTLGFGNTGVGNVTVTGAGSQWNVVNWLGVGEEGSGTLTISAGGHVTDHFGYIAGYNLNPFGSVTVTGSNSTWTNNYAVWVGGGGHGVLTIADGATVTSGTEGFVNAQGRATVSGGGSSWINDADLTVGQNGTGRLTIRQGADVSSVDGFIRNPTLHNSVVAISDSGSIWTTTNLTIGGDNAGTNGKATLALSNAGSAAVSGTLEIFANGVVDMLVSGTGTLLDVGAGGLVNHGTIRLAATPGLTSGSFSPVDVDGDWTGTGTVQTVGGVWNASTETFTITGATAGTAGNLASIDLNTSQRLAITGGTTELGVSFDPNALTGVGGSTISFTATENGTSQIESEDVLAAWDFDTDLAPGVTTQITMALGEDIDPDSLTVWHSEDGIVWAEYDVVVSYDGTHASFLVTGFSSYAFTEGDFLLVPEPTTFAMFAVGAFALMRRTKARQSQV